MQVNQNFQLIPEFIDTKVLFRSPDTLQNKNQKTSLGTFIIEF